MQLFRFALLRHISMAPHLPFRSHFLQTKSPPDRQAGAKHGWSVRLSFNSAGRCSCVRVRLGFDASCSPAHGVSTILRQQPISLQEPYLSNKYTIPWNPPPVNPALIFRGPAAFPLGCFVHIASRLSRRGRGLGAGQNSPFHVFARRAESVRFCDTLGNCPKKSIPARRPPR